MQEPSLPNEFDDSMQDQVPTNFSDPGFDKQICSTDDLIKRYGNAFQDLNMINAMVYIEKSGEEEQSPDRFFAIKKNLSVDTQLENTGNLAIISSLDPDFNIWDWKIEDTYDPNISIVRKAIVDIKVHMLSTENFSREIELTNGKKVSVEYIPYDTRNMKKADSIFQMLDDKLWEKNFSSKVAE